LTRNKENEQKQGILNWIAAEYVRKREMIKATTNTQQARM
jgi:hypothetical protein